MGLVRYERDDEALANIMKSTRAGARDVQRATGTEKARTRDSTVLGVLDEYAVSSSPEVEPTGGWEPVPPEWEAGVWVWRRQITTYGDFSTSTGPIVLMTGPPGEQGEPGDDGAPGAPGSPGASVSSLTFYYLLSATQPAIPSASPPPAPWTATEPTASPGETRALWVTVRTILSNGVWSYGPVSKSASFEASRNAFNKSNISGSSPTTADGAGRPVGAMWAQKDTTGHIVGYWEWTGSAWQARPFSNEIIPLIQADMVSFDVMDGKIITGAFIRTAESGQRLELDLNGLRSFDAAGDVSAALTAGDGGLTLVGALTTADGNSRAILSDGGVTLDNPEWVGQGVVLTRAGVESSIASQPFRIVHVSNGLGSDIELVTQKNGRIRLLGETEMLGDVGWTDLTPTGTGWTTAVTDGYPRLKARRHMGRVEIRGVGLKASWAVWDVLTVLPEWAWPAENVDGICRHTATSMSAVQIMANGQVKIGAPGSAFVVIGTTYIPKPA